MVCSPASWKCWLNLSGVRFSGGKNSMSLFSILPFFRSVISSSREHFERYSLRNSVRNVAMVPLEIMRSFSRDSKISSGRTPSLFEKIIAVAIAIFFCPTASKNSSDLRNLHVVFSRLLMRKGRLLMSCWKVEMNGMISSRVASCFRRWKGNLDSFSSRAPPAVMRPPAYSTSNRVSPYREKSSEDVSRTLQPADNFSATVSPSVSSKMATTALAKEAGSSGTAIFRFLVLIVTPPRVGFSSFVVIQSFVVKRLVAHKNCCRSSRR
mmetsp:Transcript_4435/g.10719  ORF Transcript_4435/g.10719 Transcript_4435/m.10719 type:complete len:266 (+) Transcript_4435:731-1528(+)